MWRRGLPARKTLAFYDARAAQREYFYSVCLQGRLFVEDMHPKIVTTSLKDTRLLRLVPPVTVPPPSPRALDKATVVALVALASPSRAMCARVIARRLRCG
jgi:hypothetical protein